MATAFCVDIIKGGFTPLKILLTIKVYYLLLKNANYFLYFILSSSELNFFSEFLFLIILAFLYTPFQKPFLSLDSYSLYLEKNI